MNDLLRLNCKVARRDECFYIEVQAHPTTDGLEQADNQKQSSIIEYQVLHPVNC
jgi:hypothetical protein